MGDQRLVARARRRQFGVDALVHDALGLAPGDALGIGLTQRGGFVGAGEGLVELEQRGLRRVLGSPGSCELVTIEYTASRSCLLLPHSGITLS